MIPGDVRLYTWVDVDEVLRRRARTDWPEWLLWGRAYWDGLTLGVLPGRASHVAPWLHDCFEPRYRAENGVSGAAGTIILEEIPGAPRPFPVWIEETDEPEIPPRPAPTLARSTYVLRETESDPPAPLPAELPPVFAFHSFKGGVGRTIHAVAFALLLAQKRKRVLLVDGDLEAPGITGLVRSRIPDPAIALADVLALVHGDESADAREAIRLAAAQLRAQILDDICVLPAIRNDSQAAALEIRPEHLSRGASDPYVLTRVLAELGGAVHADAVIVDLRAGLCELSAGLLLDPRVQRVLVTTLAGQSLSGTRVVLKLLASAAPSLRDGDPIPRVLLTQVTDEQRASEAFATAQDELNAAVAEVIQGAVSSDNNAISTSFDQRLLALPEEWQTARLRIEQFDVGASLAVLVDALPVRSSVEPQPSMSLRERRTRLRDRAKALIYAEAGGGEGFLPTTSLRNLAAEHQNRVPVVVMVGAKGAGKTYTFLQLARLKTWDAFVQQATDAGASHAGGLSQTPVFPLLLPQSLNDGTEHLLRDIRAAVAGTVLHTTPQAPSEARARIRKWLNEDLDQTQWRQCWLNLFAWSLGFRVGDDEAAAHLFRFLRETGQQLILLMDGLEDLLQDIADDARQQQALRALLQEVPERLRQEPGRPLGMVLFVRRDLILSAVRQNSGQFLQRYDPYELRWNREEALRLVLWIAEHVDGPRVSPAELAGLNEEALAERLIPLWGRKLGGENSREARAADWVLSALSDLRGQIQARDLVRLLHLAAGHSVQDRGWGDRVLTPQAIRNALPECSKEKISEVRQEHAALGEVLQRLERAPKAQRTAPFAPEDLKLSHQDLELLTLNGVVLRDGDRYYLAEIYRPGLDFALPGRGRARVMWLARRAGQPA